MNPLLLLLAVAGRTRERESSSCLSSHIGHSNRAHFLHSMRNDVFCAIAFVVVLHQPVNELRANRSWSYFIAPFHYCYFDFDGQPNAIIIRCWCICCSLLLMRLRCVAQYFSWFRSHCCCRGCRQQPSIVRTINKNQCATRPGAICIQHSALSVRQRIYRMPICVMRRSATSTYCQMAHNSASMSVLMATQSDDSNYGCVAQWTPLFDADDMCVCLRVGNGILSRN